MLYPAISDARMEIHTFFSPYLPELHLSLFLTRYIFFLPPIHIIKRTSDLHLILIIESGHNYAANFINHLLQDAKLFKKSYPIEITQF